MTPAIAYDEALIGERPIMVRRRALWSECDPARVVFTGHFFSYVGSAYSWFARLVMGVDDPDLAGHGIVAPIKAISIEFHAMLRADDWVRMTALVGDIRTHSLDVDILCAREEGSPVFTARVSPILVDDRSKTAMKIPDRLRAALESYRAVQSRPPADRPPPDR